MASTSDLRGGLLVLNAGSSSLKFAIYRPGTPPTPQLKGNIDRVGRPGSTITATGSSEESFAAANPKEAAARFLDWLGRRVAVESLGAVGHRVVHGGPRFDRPTRIDADLLAELGRLA